MELLSQVRHLWLEYNSKGQWETKNGEKIYIEEMTDEHLMRIPPFIFRKLDHDQRSKAWSFIPWIIRLEIRERNMYIDYKNQCTVKRNVIIEDDSSQIVIPKPKTRRNKILFK